MDDLKGILAIFMVFSIPLSAIGAFVYLRAKTIAQKALTGEEREVLLEIKAENAELKRRLSNIETIVSDVDDVVLKLNRPTAEEITPEQLEKLAQKLRNK